MRLANYLFSGLLVLCVGSLLAYEEEAVMKAYTYLSTKWSYYDINGNKIKVEGLSWKSAGDNYEIMVNDESVDPSTMYDSDGKGIVNPSIKNNAKPLVIIGNEPGVLKGITEAHNVFRRQTGGGLPNLTWDNGLAAYAQKWANRLRDTNGCNMEHRNGATREGKSYGENLALAEGQELSPQDVVQMWYDEIKDYDYDSNSCTGVCGHYTQVVWKKSKKVGCGMAKCGSKEVWVCNYDPPGNYNGEKPY